MIRINPLKYNINIITLYYLWEVFETYMYIVRINILYSYKQLQFKKYF